MNEVQMKRSIIRTASATALAFALALTSVPAQAKSTQTVITVWTFKQSEVKALQVLGRTWGPKNHAIVKVSVYTPDDAYTTKIQSAAKLHTLPDILFVHSQGQDWVLAQAGIVTDLTKDFTKSWQSQFLPGVVSGMNLTKLAIANSGNDPVTTLKNLQAGHYYSIPFLAGTPGVIFANKTALSKAGISTKTPPANWQEWVSDIQKTMAKDSKNGGVVTGLQVAETGFFWLYRPMAYAFLGKDAFYGREGRGASPAWDSATSVKTLALYDELSPLWAPGVLSLGIDQADQTFAAGKAAWDVGGTFTLSSLNTFGLSSKDVMVFPVPAAKGGVLPKLSYAASPLIGGSITTTSKNQALALSFLKYATSVAGATSFARKATDLPATKINPLTLSSPLLKQLVGLIATGKDASTAFSPNDFSADPAGSILHDTSVKLSGLAAKTTNPSDLATSLTALYKAAWAVAK
jgi:ABC-type glycerol-3-phosphate transport system substrate-binding protein